MLLHFLAELEKISSIPGLPDRKAHPELPEVKEPTTWQFGIHKHEAEKRGLHWDLRLANGEGAYSWSMPPKMPAPGESLLVHEEPIHSREYIDWQGQIPKGTYGAGKVSLKDRDKIEVVNARPGHISFNLYKGYGPEEFTLHRVGGKIWKFYNRTLSRDKHDLPTDKPKYKEVDIEKAHELGDEYLMSAKIDDAHNLFYFSAAGEKVRVVSHRVGKKSPSTIIEHTHKIPSIDKIKVPKELSGTILRGGIYAMHPLTKTSTPLHIIGGMLNSDVWKSREKQKEHGELKPVIYDVVQYKGKDLSKAPYKEKLEVLKKVHEHFPQFELPEMAFSKKEKQKLIQDIKEGKHPETSEGVVLWNLEKGEPAIKSKFMQEHDVYIRGFFPGKKRLEGKGIGGFVYSHTEDGPIVGECGTGFDDKMRAEMMKNPEKYLGMVAVVEAQHKYKDSEALRVPSFKAFHLEKNELTRLQEVYK